MLSNSQAETSRNLRPTFLVDPCIYFRLNAVRFSLKTRISEVLSVYLIQFYKWHSYRSNASIEGPAQVRVLVRRLPQVLQRPLLPRRARAAGITAPSLSAPFGILPSLASFLRKLSYFHAGFCHVSSII